LIYLRVYTGMHGQQNIRSGFTVHVETHSL